MPNPHYRRPPKKGRIKWILLGAFLLAGSLFALNYTGYLPLSRSVQQQSNESATVVSPLEEQREPLETRQPEQKAVADETPPSLETAPPQPPSITMEQEDAEPLFFPPLQPPQCVEAADQLVRFFTALDARPYIQAYKLSIPSQEHFTALVNTLLSHPPTVSRETDDLYTILTNMAHFFRIIGNDNIQLIKAILDRERDIVEDVGLTLYSWITSNCSSEAFTLQAPLEGLYEYAGFFLNTMGGRSYLFRRDSRSRLLIHYYAVLVVQRANEAGINRHGLNLEEYLGPLINEIEASNQLVYKELYLDHLYSLLEASAQGR